MLFSFKSGIEPSSMQTLFALQTLLSSGVSQKECDPGYTWSTWRTICRELNYWQLVGQRPVSMRLVNWQLDATASLWENQYQGLEWNPLNVQYSTATLFVAEYQVNQVCRGSAIIWSRWNLAFPGRAASVCVGKVKVSLEFLASGGSRESLLSKVEDSAARIMLNAASVPSGVYGPVPADFIAAWMLQAALAGEIAKARLLWFVFPSAR